MHALYPIGSPTTTGLQCLESPRLSRCLSRTDLVDHGSTTVRRLDLLMASQVSNLTPNREAQRGGMLRDCLPSFTDMSRRDPTRPNAFVVRLRQPLNL